MESLMNILVGGYFVGSLVTFAFMLYLTYNVAKGFNEGEGREAIKLYVVATFISLFWFVFLPWFVMRGVYKSVVVQPAAEEVVRRQVARREALERDHARYVLRQNEVKFPKGFGTYLETWMSYTEDEGQ